jgi:hypothetical protein
LAAYHLASVQEQTGTVELPGVAGSAFGVRAVVGGGTSHVLARMVERLPPDWQASDSQADDPRFILTTADGLEYVLKRDGAVLTVAELEVALGVFDAQLRGYIALNSPDYIFVHAGVVGNRGRAIVIPGRSFSGKTTLVSELVRAGATYYSDEYAVLDEEGLVHPYAKPLSMRLEEGSRLQTDHYVADLGGSAGVGPLPVGLIISAQYRFGARWQPQRLTSGDAVLELLANTVPAQERPQQSLAAISRAVDGATALQGDRGEAAEIADQLLAELPA